MPSLLRARRLERRYREHLASWEPRLFSDAEWLEQQRKAQARMDRQDRMISDGCGLSGRLTRDMVAAGPLKTDEWFFAPSMAGIGRRLGRLTDQELEAQEFGRW